MEVADGTTSRPNVDPGSQAWLDSVVETAIDPEVPIIDTHHHLWPEGGAFAYGLAELESDLCSSHNIVDSVFVECRASYDDDAPPHLRPVGETRFVAGEAARSSMQVMGGIVAHADLTDEAHLDEVIDAHQQAADGRFRGIRHSGSHAREPEVLAIPGRAPAGLYAQPDFRTGVRALGEHGLTYDTWHYHYQNEEFLEFARSAPGTTIVLDHFGTPLGVGRYESQREEIYEQWRLDIEKIAACENVVAKLGGLAMPDNGFGW
ncbi:MAG: amidohydrolase, partial [Actinobacteria bacterium]